MRLLIAPAALFFAAPTPAAAERWNAPVPGAITRVFDLRSNPFEGGRHRGVDFAAVAGTPVRAACGGPVVVAGEVGSAGRVVTIRCGRWRVSHLPLATVGVRVGTPVRRGQPIGTAAADHAHAGLHLGARREGRRFGYTDPLRFLGPDRGHRPAPPIGPGSRERRAPARPPSPRPVRAPRGAPVSPPSPRPVRAPHNALVAEPAGAPAHSPALPAGSSPVGERPREALAPWPAWLGLALALAGAVGAIGRRRPRPRRRPLPRAAVEDVG